MTIHNEKHCINYLKNNMKLKAYPKVNLCLKIYKGLTSEIKHKIDSVLCIYRKIHDTISIKKSHELFVLYKDRGKNITISDCIVSKSLRYLESKYGIDVNYYIVINKRIPIGSGLGGGSADAAAVINYVLRQNAPIQLDLREIALELGSDIPFFLSHYQIARVKEFGQYVTPIYNWHPRLELTFTNIVCSTPKVYEALDGDKDYVSRVDVDRVIENHLYKQHLINVVYNDLTKYIIQNYRELQDVYKKYTNNSFLTGAGSTIVTIKE